MNLSKDKLVNIAEKHLSNAEKKGSVIYLFADKPAPGTFDPIDSQRLTIPPTANILFVDLLPGANWAHPSLYILTDQSGEVLDKFDVEFPPFDNHLRILKKPGDIQDWMLLSTDYVQ